MITEMVIGHVPSFAHVGRSRTTPTLGRARLMSILLREMLRRKIGFEPPGSSLVVESRRFNDIDTYTVIFRYDDRDRDASAYRLNLLRARESDWDDDARRELQQAI